MTTPEPAHTLHVDGLATIHHSSLRGKRTTQADHITVLRGPYALAIAVCDGAGDNDDAAQAAHLVSQIAAAVTGTTADPAEGLSAARTYLRKRNNGAPSGHDGITTATIAAIGVPGRAEAALAWAGDSPAWAITPGGAVVPLTIPSCHPCQTPCNVAEGHATATSRWPHQRDIVISRYTRLILATDGLTADLPLYQRPHHVNAMTDTLAKHAIPGRDGAHVLASLLHHIQRGPASDNTTIAVIDLHPSSPHA